MGGYIIPKTQHRPLIREARVQPMPTPHYMNILPPSKPQQILPIPIMVSDHQQRLDREMDRVSSHIDVHLLLGNLMGSQA